MPPLDWSLDGKFIAFSAKDMGRETINLVSVENLETRKLSNRAGDRQDWGPAFSPDEEQLAFVRTNGALTVEEIYTMPATGAKSIG